MRSRWDVDGLGAGFDLTIQTVSHFADFHIVTESQTALVAGEFGGATFERAGGAEMLKQGRRARTISLRRLAAKQLDLADALREAQPVHLLPCFMG